MEEIDFEIQKKVLEIDFEKSSFLKSLHQKSLAILNARKEKKWKLLQNLLISSITRELPWELEEGKNVLDFHLAQVCKSLESLLNYFIKNNLQEGIIFYSKFQKIYGKSALILSGGGSLALTHLGVIKELLENDLLPPIISGSSAGSIIAALICTKELDELDEIFDPEKVDTNILEDASNGKINNISLKIKRLIKTGLLFDSRILTRSMQKIFGDMTFLEAYEKTKKILNITVTPSNMNEKPKVLNYISSPNVLIWSAIVASCSIPALFKGADLYIKLPDGKLNPVKGPHSWIDGSIENDIPVNELLYLHGVRNLIVSQVNPHVSIFINLYNSKSLIISIIFKILHFIKFELIYRIHFFPSIIMPQKLFHYIIALISQTYMGDITITPYKFGLFDLLKSLVISSQRHVKSAIENGRYATKNKISEIIKRSLIEKKIDMHLKILSNHLNNSLNYKTSNDKSCTLFKTLSPVLSPI